MKWIAIPVASNRQMVDDSEKTSNEDLHRIPVANHRQMVDDSEMTPFEDIHRVAAVATAAVAT
ncbi:MAG: hypothetical protein ACKN9U_15065 [Pirellulaceae bacterium]